MLEQTVEIALTDHAARRLAERFPEFDNVEALADQFINGPFYQMDYVRQKPGHPELFGRVLEIKGQQVCVMYTKPGNIDYLIVTIKFPWWRSYLYNTD